MDEKLENQTPENEVESKVYSDPNEGAVYEEIRSEEPRIQGAASYTYGEPGPRPENNQSASNGMYGNPQGNPYSGYNNNPQGNPYNPYNNNPQSNPYNSYNNMNYREPEMDNTPLSMGEWLLTLLAAMIPCAGIILYFVWAFSKSGNVNRRNFCRAYLIIEAIAVALGLIFAIFITFTVGMSSYYY